MRATSSAALVVALSYAWLLFFAVVPPALAQEDPQEGSPSITKMEANLENLSKGGSAYTIKGGVPQLPDGTSLHVSLEMKDTKSNVKAAFFRVIVRGGEYDARKTWRQTFPPGIYLTRCDLIVSEQNRAIRRHLAKEFGYRYEHRELLSSSESRIGAPEDLARVRKTSLESMRSFLEKLVVLRQRIQEATEKPAAEQEEWADKEKELYGELRKMRQPFMKMKQRYVVWPGQNEFESMTAPHDDLTRAVRDHAVNKSENIPKELERIAHLLSVHLADIDARLRAVTEDEKTKGQEEGSQ